MLDQGISATEEGVSSSSDTKVQIDFRLVILYLQFLREFHILNNNLYINELSIYNTGEISNSIIE